MHVVVMMTLCYISAIAVVGFWCVCATIVPLAFAFLLMIRMWAGAICWNSAVLIANAISWSMLLPRGTLFSVLSIRRLSAMLDLAIGAGPGPKGALQFWARGGSVSHLVAGVATDFG